MGQPDPAWGETPWDNLSREQLIVEVARYYSATLKADAALALLSIDGSLHAFWSKLGAGGQAIARCKEALSRVDHGSLWRSFFRYADDLLFSAPIGTGWRVCSKGHMTGTQEMSALKCFLCDSEVHPLKWSDLDRSDLEHG